MDALYFMTKRNKGIMRKHFKVSGEMWKYLVQKVNTLLAYQYNDCGDKKITNERRQVNNMKCSDDIIIPGTRKATKSPLQHHRTLRKSITVKTLWEPPLITINN